jgi:DNA-binding FrmR family transcriptional regulator
MSHTSREKLDLVNRTQKVIGQLESVLKGRNDDEQCSEVLRRLAASRGAIYSHASLISHLGALAD